jgi:4-hydroxybenzoate polyprenyltransferase
VPIVTSQELTDLTHVVQTAYAFIAFSLIASSVYVLNDLFDLDNDRQHHEKKARPFASGEVSLRSGIVALPVLIGASAAISLVFLPGEFLFLVAGYFILNVGYSLYLKQVALIDVLMLAMFYSWRVIAGAVATHIALSHWLLVFSVFMFLSLAFAKRVSELQFMRDSEKKKTDGRGYLANDLEQLASFGVASGYIAVLVFALYINSPGVKQLYTSTETLWIVCPLLLYWVSRLWLLVHRRQVPEDPVVFVCKDLVSYVVGIAIAISLTIAN